MRYHPIFRIHSILLIVLATCLIGGLTGCRSGPQASPDAKRYELKGTVVSVDRRGETITISHGDIPGYMDAMTMSFKPKDSWVLDQAQPGNGIQATLVVDGLRSWLENVVLTQQTVTDKTLAAASAEPQPGDTVADFSLIDQDGKPISLRDYHGRALVVTFIYTRCPLPDYCPLMINNFAEIVNQIKGDADLYDKSRLLSVSIDPAYDTPKVLRDYGAKDTGETGTATFSHWKFATGQPDDVKKVAMWFGLEYWPDGNQVVHALRTAVIAPDGKLVKIYHGNDWKPVDIVADLQSLKSQATASLSPDAQAAQKNAATKDKSAPSAASPDAKSESARKTYHGVGVVVSINDQRTMVEIDHEDIKDLMSAMKMSFEVKSPALLNHIAPGDGIRFTLEETPHGLVVIEIQKR